MLTKERLKNIGINIKSERLRCGMSQEELAEQVGVATKTVSYWENAHNPVSFSKIPLIADVLNIPIYKLFVFVDVDDKLADKDYITLLQSKTGEELNTLFNIIKELQKIS